MGTFLLMGGLQKLFTSHRKAPLLLLKLHKSNLVCVKVILHDGAHFSLFRLFAIALHFLQGLLSSLQSCLCLLNFLRSRRCPLAFYSKLRFLLFRKRFQVQLTALQNGCAFLYCFQFSAAACRTPLQSAPLPAKLPNGAAANEECFKTQ